MTSLRGRRILVVEDSYMLACQLEDWLRQAGAEVDGPWPRADQALASLRRNGDAIGAAVLDLQLGGGMTSHAVADDLTRRAIPFVFATAADRTLVAPAHQAVPWLAKPVTKSGLVVALRGLLEHADPGTMTRIERYSPARGGLSVRPEAFQVPQLQTRRVLVVEDDPLVRFSIAEALRELNLSVVEASSAEEAWNYLTTEHGIGVVFADNDLTGLMSGAALGSRMAAEFPEITFLLTSGRDDIDGWTACVVAKPYDVVATAFMLAQHAEAIARDDRGEAGHSLHPSGRG